MRPRPLAVALGVLTGLTTLTLLLAQQPILRLAIANGVNYIFLPLAILALLTFSLCMAGQAIMLALHGSYGGRRDAI
jgi:hypothetical protein